MGGIRETEVWRPGGCHCRAVRFEALLAGSFEAEDCNCSICAMSGNIHVILPASHFRLVQGQEYLTEYRFNTGVARHLFCRVCGIKSFYFPRSNPDGVAVTWRALDDWISLQVQVNPFNGRDWEANAGRLAHKSRS